MTVPAVTPPVTWRELVLPKEHGSWSLALEPVALGLLAAPSRGGAALAVATIAAFFVRRPLRIGTLDARRERRLAARRAAVACGAIAVAGWFAAMFSSGATWWPWLIPSAMAGAGFLWFDLQQSGREQLAEVMGAAAFSFLPAVFAVLAGWTSQAALALAVVMLSRSIPTVLTVRAWLRGRKTGTHRPLIPLIASTVAVIMVAALAMTHVAPFAAAVVTLALLARAVMLLVAPRPNARASTMGVVEATLGVAYVATVAISWHAFG